MMQEIVRARSTLTPYFNDVRDRTNYHFKRHAIQNSIYGVDVDAGPVEIAKLRLWLSLVVDEEDVKQIKPLPNLDYKIVSGNSLLGFPYYENPRLIEIEKLKLKFFDEPEHTRKEKLKKQIDNELKSCFADSKKNFGYEINFDFKVCFSEIFNQKKGFDIVIMNPPYGAEFNQIEKNILKKKYDYVVERIPNSFLYFLGLAYEITKQQGVVSVIQPNEFLFQIYMTKARRFFIQNTQILYAINVGEDVFKAVVPTCVIAFQKNKLGSYQIPVADLRECSLPELSIRLNKKSFTLSSTELILATPDNIFSFDLLSTTLVNKLAANFKPLEDYCTDVASGISTSCDGVYIVKEDFAKAEEFEVKHLKPCIRGGQINRFITPLTTKEYVLYINENFDAKKAPNIYRYLLKNKELLIRKCVEKKNGSRDWAILFRSRSENLFKKPKIMIRQTGDSIIATTDTDVGYYCIDSVNIVLLKDELNTLVDYFVGLLNSSLLKFYYREISQEGGRVLAQVKPQRIRSLPIVIATSAKQKSLINLVQSIIQIKEKNPEADVSKFERQIDNLVYSLYGLTAEEIKIIEGY